MKTNIFIGLLSLLCLSACYEGDRVYRFTTKSYVCEYMKLNEKKDTFVVEYHGGPNIYSEYMFLPDFGYGYFVSLNSKNSAVYGLYTDLCKKHNDQDYVREVRYMTGEGFFGYTYYYIDPVSIDIVSDADFDEKHPAGVSLADLFYFNSLTPYPFIRNGCQGDELTRIKQRLDLLTPEEMILSMHRGKLIDDRNFVYPPGTGIKQPFISLPAENLPTLSQTHTFTITIVDDYGRTFTGKVTVEFLEII